MKAKLIKERGYYDLYRIDKDGKKVTFASTEDYKQKLSKQNCDELFGVFDIESWIKETLNDADVKDELMLKTSKMCLKAGFNKAMELNKDKLFTLEDMFNLYAHIVKNGIISGEEANEFIQSLQQPTEIEVEIEMECPQCQEWGYVSGCRKDCNKKFLQPKLDSEGCLILKRVV